jgi:hypothetical protein
MDIENDIITNEGENIFQLRLIKSEGIGLATTKGGKNCLLLDSSDYWYDSIQDSYPKIKKCSCKNDWFKLKFKYYYREHYNDVKRIEVKTFCVNCGQALTVMDIDIKYSPTEHLVNNPLVYCKEPNIKYHSKTISRILEPEQFHKIIYYLSEMGFILYCWYWNDENKKHELKIISEVLQGFIYRNVEPRLASALHDQGFISNGRAFKLFTFSRIFGKPVLNPEKTLFIFGCEAEFAIASPMDFFLRSLISTIAVKPDLRLHNNDVKLTGFEITDNTLKEEVSVTVKVETLSPVAIYSTLQKPNGVLFA